jgi:hypothetical protein
VATWSFQHRRSEKELDMRPRLIRFFLLTWFSFAFFYSTTMPFLLERTVRDVIRPAIITGFFVALVSSIVEWMRLRHKERSAVT